MATRGGGRKTGGAKAAAAAEARRLIRRHRLRPHPEGGHYREVFRDAVQVPHPTKGTPRAALTHILFLLEEGDFSAFHRVAQSELWQHLAGAPLELVVLPRGARAPTRVVLGTGQGQRPAFAVPPFALQAARPLGGCVLCGCSVAPGFSFEDFELPSREALRAELPGLGRLVDAWTRAPAEAVSPRRPPARRGASASGGGTGGGGRSGGRRASPPRPRP